MNPTMNPPRRRPTPLALLLLLALAVTSGRAMVGAASSDVPPPQAATAAAHANPVLPVLLGVVVMLAGAKLGGWAAERLRQPAVLGELLAGVAFGSLALAGWHGLDFLATDPGLRVLAELGVILLLFEVGLESDLGEMRAVGASSLLVACLGVVAPFLLGWGASAWLLPDEPPLVHVFIGATLCATSVGITARVLADLGALASREAKIVLGAAVVDDVLGLVLLAVVTGSIEAANEGVALDPLRILVIVAKALAFLVGALALGGPVSRRLLRLAARLEQRGVLLVASVVFCLLLAWLASAFGLAPIVGAFAAGLILDEVHYHDARQRVERRLEDLLRPVAALLVPLFFVRMGAEVDLRAFARPDVLVLAALLTVAAVLGKMACALGVREPGVDRLSVAIGMLPRGEVGLIFAGVGAQLTVGGRRVIDPGVFSAVIVMVLATTVLAPPLLAWALARANVTRTALVVVGALTLALPLAAARAPALATDPERAYATIAKLAAAESAVRERAAEAILRSGDKSLVAPLVDQLFFVPSRQRAEILRVLAGLTGERRERYLDWVDYVGEHPEQAPPRGYLGFKGRTFARIDPQYGELLRDGVATRIRAEEIVSGGVPFDGIPALEQPLHLFAEVARLADDELVFAAEVGGEARAWPLAVLSWHEMLDDRLGGEPVTLSYCTLCRSAVLFRGRLPDGRETTFGTSGLLYRSNKLMFDRATRTLWSNLTGEPVLGPLAAAAQPLDALPLVLERWGAWRAEHPRTTVMVGDPAVARRHGFVYRPGAADARRFGVEFPVPGEDARLAAKEEVWGVRFGGAVKAYAVPALLAAGVVEDTVGAEPIVIVADAASGAIRAYRRGAHRFRAGGARELLDETGARFRVEEDALRAVAAPGGGAAAHELTRIPGWPSYWFAWQSFYPGSALWTGTAGAGHPTP